MAANVQIPGYAKTLMAIAAIFMPVFLILPFFFWGNENNSIELGEANIQRGRLAPIGRLTIASDSAAADTASSAAAFDPVATYNNVCAACHATGLLNAPKFGEPAGWQAKISERGGIDALIQQGIQGIGGMPAKGGASISDENFAIAVKYMLANSGIEVDYQAPGAEGGESATPENNTESATPENQTETAPADSASADNSDVAAANTESKPDSATPENQTEEAAAPADSAPANNNDAAAANTESKPDSATPENQNETAPADSAPADNNDAAAANTESKPDSATPENQTEEAAAPADSTPAQTVESTTESKES